MADKKKELKGNDLEKVSGGVPLLRGNKGTKDIQVMDAQKAAEKDLTDNKSVVTKGRIKPKVVI